VRGRKILLHLLRTNLGEQARELLGVSERDRRDGEKESIITSAAGRKVEGGRGRGRARKFKVERKDHSAVQPGNEHISEGEGTEGQQHGHEGSPPRCHDRGAFQKVGNGGEVQRDDRRGGGPSSKSSI